MVRAPRRRFTYSGRAHEAADGATLLAALAADGVPTLGRSTRYHRPRAPFCGIGQCAGCLVRVNGRPGVRSCRHVVADGDRVESEAGWPSARFDVFAVLDALFPGGIDTLRGFRRPAFAVPLYQRVVRRLAGYGRPPDPGSERGIAAPPLRVDAEVAVVGGGRSGRAAAARLVALGARPTLLDRDPSGPDLPGVDRHRGVSVTYLPPPAAGGERPFTLLGFSEPARGVLVRARRVVVAVGGYDASLLFDGNDRPGVQSADGALALAAALGHAPFRRGVVVGGGARARAVLEALGPSVGAVVAPGEIRPEVVRLASDLGIPLYPHSLVLGTRGRGRVRALVLRARGTGAGFSVDGDAVVLAHRRLPNAQLFFQAGAKMAWGGGTGAYYPVTDAAGATSVPGLFAVGEAAGVAEPFAAESGERSADAIAGTASGPLEPLEGVARPGPAELEGYYREVLAARPRGRWIACACEDVRLDELLDGSSAGYRGIEVLKRYSSLGTGLCQGRYCVPDALLVLSLLEGRPPSEVGYLTQRPPVHPTPLAALAALSGALSEDPRP